MLYEENAPQAVDFERVTVSELNKHARQLLEYNFPKIWVEGEISNLATPRSGHVYFSLKDDEAQVRCALFRFAASRVPFDITDGLHVAVRAKVSLYENRGDYQLIVDQMEEVGEGKLQREFEALKKKLAAEGLFAEEHKQEIPELPECIGVITSATGAALRDILHVLDRRFPAIPVIVYPTLVQGDQAPAQIIKAIKTANRRKDCDVLLLARGGGSIEDLWCFNDEQVARAIFQSKLPIISGVGHEIDFTIADFVADERAPTPSAAAELVSPDAEEWLGNYQYYAEQLWLHMKHHLDHLRHELAILSKQLKHPGERLQQLSQQVDFIEQRLTQAMQNRLQNGKQMLQSLARNLDALSPLATLNRGYAIVKDEAGKIIRSVDQVSIKNNVLVTLSQGILHCQITDME